ncbi:MAG: sulfite exporter TauE/SafE family protein [Cyclobacteriaceae bacterium]
MENIVGLIAAITIGVSLGLIGGGGSILTVPALVYLMHVEPVLATAYSLFVVGIASLIGSFSYMKKGLVSYRTAVVFAIPSLTAVFLTRKYLVPAIPSEILHLGDFVLTKDLAIMLFFAVIMVAAAYSMIRSGKKKDLEEEEIKFNYPMILLEGAIVGVLTGIVGAGGGFLIIPALVILARLPMKMAVGTSLLIIAVKSLIGFTGDISEQIIDWNFLMLFSGFAIGGIVIGSFASKYVSAGKLKGAFGWFVLVMGAYIIARELMVTI